MFPLTVIAVGFTAAVEEVDIRKVSILPPIVAAAASLSNPTIPFSVTIAV